VKPFKFRLQTKLDIACREEQQAREDLQICLAHRDQLQNELDGILLQIKETEAAMIRMMQEGFNLQQFLVFKDYLPILKEFRQLKEAELAQAESMVIEARRILIDKMKESKTLKKLREKEWARYLLELNKEEQKIIDELAINNHFRKETEPV